MLSLFNLSFTFGNDQPDPSSPVATRSEVLHSDGSERAGRRLLQERFDHADKQTVSQL